ncbi:hypothetical protein D0469_20185 [Peribacillus saganii]|uniref:Uncharacterized protein n=1 Tax=Peribacillus saganii TaxID=2303992 RepID=A0A372LAN1_9BACI|nr:hypothetical protein D0469_20185 [Peribacillus saganii]
MKKMDDLALHNSDRKKAMCNSYLHPLMCEAKKLTQKARKTRKINKNVQRKNMMRFANAD